MVRSFAKRNGIDVNFCHVYEERRTEIKFMEHRYLRHKIYHILWDEVATLSEACATIYADLMLAWDLKGSQTGASAHDNSEDVRFKIKTVIFNDPATIVLWEDGTKTVVKCQENDIYSKETGLALCIAKKALGNKGNFNEVFKKWIPEEEPVGEYYTSTEIPICRELTELGFNGNKYNVFRKMAEEEIIKLFDQFKKELNK